MKKSFFVTSCDTDIGKTFITTALSNYLTKLGVSVRAVKPIVTGWDPEDRDSDTALILKSLSMSMETEEIENASPWRYKEPQTPHIAAQNEGRPIHVKEVATFCDSPYLNKNIECVLMEGVGGVMTPIDTEHTILDLIAMIESPVLLVVGTYLGSISHSLAAEAVLRYNRIAVDCICVNETPGSSVSLDDTVKTLQHFVDAPIVKVPWSEKEMPEERWEHVAEQMAFMSKVLKILD